MVILVLALGGLAYVAGLEYQSERASAAAQQMGNAHGRELLLYRTALPGLVVTNSGPSSSEIVGIYFRFPNGSVYYGSAFAPVYLPVGAAALVQGMVPPGTCLPAGTSTCLSRFSAINGTKTPGYSVGVVTALGNVFWYASGANLVKWSYLTSFPAGCPAGQFISALSPSPTCGAAGVTSKLCTAVSPGGVDTLTCSSLPAYTYYIVQFAGQASGQYSYQLYVRFNGVSSSVYAESYPEPNQAWSSCDYSTADKGFDVLHNDVGFTAFTMNVAAVSGSGYLATWSSMAVSSLSGGVYPNSCTGAGAFPSSSGLTSISVTNSGTTWAAGTTLTVYGMSS
jgi:hypothetical protein